MTDNKAVAKKIFSSISKFIKGLRALRTAGGLSVSDSALRYVRFLDDGTFKKASLRLPPGIVEDGKVKDKANLLKALIVLRSRVDVHKDELAEIIVSLESRVVYSQFFNLPELSDESLEEAAELNIQMISPMPLNQAYYGYERVGKPVNGIGFEYLAAFASSSVIDEWVSVLKDAGFIAVAIEFQSLSVVRLAMELDIADRSVVSLLVDISDEGLNLSLVKNGNLYFDYFYPWKMIQGEDKTITTERFEAALTAESSKVVNFAISKFGESVKSIMVNSDSLGSRAVALLSEKFPRVSVIEIPVAKELCCSFSAAAGAAKRAVATRSTDNLISLTPVKVADEYFRARLFSMIRIWRRGFIVILLFFIFAFGASDLFFRSLRISAAERTIRGLSPDEAIELAALTADSTDFNKLIALVSEARRGENKFEPLISKIVSSSGDVKITKISIQNLAMPVNLVGEAPSADSISKFSRRLSEIKSIAEIQLPLSSIVSAPNGKTSFSMSFKILSLEI